MRGGEDHRLGPREIQRVEQGRGCCREEAIEEGRRVGDHREPVFELVEPLGVLRGEREDRSTDCERRSLRHVEPSPPRGEIQSGLEDLPEVVMESSGPPISFTGGTPEATLRAAPVRHP